MIEKDLVKQGSESGSYRKAITINGKKIEKRFSRKSDADRWYLEKRREKELVESGLALKIEDITLQEFATKWLQFRKLSGKPLSSWESDEGRLRKYVLPEFGIRHINKISTSEWESFLDSLVASDLIASATRNRIRSLVTKMYNDALRQGVVNINPVSIIPKLKESMDAWDYWASVSDIISYIEYARIESDWFYLFAVISLNTGARIGEILGLDLEDVNLRNRRIHIKKVFEETSGTVQNRTKGHKERWLGINDSLYEALVTVLGRKKSSKSNDPLIADQNNTRLYERQVRRVHERVCTKAKLKSIRIHDLRHTYASHYIMNGGNLVDLQSLLGHSSPMMTLKYAHLEPGYLEKKSGVVNFGTVGNNVLQLVKSK